MLEESKALTVEELSETISKENLSLVLEYLHTVKYGTITLIIQDGKLVQIDKLEKIRFK
jgi:hypothetical protein